MFKKDSEGEIGTRLYSAGVFTVCNDVTTVYLFENLASLTSGKVRPPRVEIIHCEHFTYNGFVCECSFQDLTEIMSKPGVRHCYVA